MDGRITQLCATIKYLLIILNLQNKINKDAGGDVRPSHLSEIDPS